MTHFCFCTISVTFPNSDKQQGESLSLDPFDIVNILATYSFQITRLLVHMKQNFHILNLMLPGLVLNSKFKWCSILRHDLGAA